MVLSDEKLMELIHSGYIPSDVHLGPCSVDLTLAEDYLVPHLPDDRPYLTITEDYPHKLAPVESFVLYPQKFVLASTNELIKIPDHMCGVVHGRSSVGRLGIQVQNAGFIDAGFVGQITLELVNQSNAPVLLKPNMRICQLVMHNLHGQSKRPYRGKYQGQVGPTPSRIKEDEE